MTDTTINQDLNQAELAKLAKQIIFEPDDFNLLFARINAPTRRDQLISDLKNLLQAEDIEVIDIATDSRTDNLLARFRQAIAARDSQDTQFCFSITDLDLAILRLDSNILNHLNFNRELFLAAAPCPLIFWLPEMALTRLAQIAPDFWAWRSGVIEFTDDLKDSLAEFTLANGTRPAPNYLSPPSPSIPFVGREDIRQHVLQSLAESSETEPKVIGFVGLGGVGKSALATRLAHDVTSLFPGGVLWLPLNGTNSLELYQQILRAYGAPLHGPDPVKTLSEIKKLLQRYRVLMILDDADQYPLAETILNELKGLATFLTTSRTRSLLPPHTSVFTLPSLSPNDAVRLLSARLNISKPRLIQDKNSHIILQELCIKLECLPLAIIHAAGYIHSTGISPNEYLQLLDDGPPLSHRFVDDSRPLLNMIRSAFSLLNQEQKLLLVLIAKDRGETVHIDTLTTVTSIIDSTSSRRTHLKIFRNVSTLLANALIDRVHADRYQTHPLVRSFIRSELSDQESVEIERNLIDYYLQYVRQHREYTAQAYNALDKEYSNIQGAMDMAYELEQWSDLVQFSRYLCDYLDGYLSVRGYWAELRKRLTQGIKAAQLIGDKLNEAFFNHAYGNLSFGQGDYSMAHHYYESVLELLQAENKDSKASVLYTMGQIAQAQGNYDEAIIYYQNILAANDVTDDQVEQARYFQKLGQLFHNQSLYAQAKAYYQNALTINIELGAQREQAISLQLLGELYQSQDMYAQAEEYYKQALTIYTEMGARREQAISLRQLGELYKIRNMYDQAEEYYQQALAINYEMGNIRELATSLQRLGELAQSRGLYEQAEAYLQQALNILESNERLQPS